MTSNVYDQVLLVGDIEATFRTVGVPNLLSDSFDVGDLSPTPNIQRLERNVQRANFSPVISRTGRKQQQFSFTHEIMGTGQTDASVEPAYGRFLRACGMSQTQISSAGLAHSHHDAGNAREGVVSAAHASDNYVGTMARFVVATVVSATTVDVTSGETPAGVAEQNDTAVVATSGVAIPGPQGAQIELTYTGDLVVGDRYYFLFTPPGHLYAPTSDITTLESMYMYGYFGNKRHLITGARGTFSFSATAGEFSAMNFTFTGDYNDATDIVFPAVGSYSYGSYPQPPIVELADVGLGGVQVACPTTYGFDLANTVAARLCANAKDANDGSIITGRSPSATFNMDSVPLSAMNIYQMLSEGTTLALTGYVGTKDNNHMFFAAFGQITNTQYAEQDQLRKNDNTLGLAGSEGNDELLIFVS